MKEELKVIPQVQFLDAAIRSIRQRLESIPGTLSSLDQKERAWQGEFELVREKKEDARRTRRAMEKELEEGGEHLKKLNLQLNQVKTNKEYTALLHEIESQKEAISLLEEKILVEMESLERLETEEKASAKLLEARKKELAEKRLALASDQEKLEKELAEHLKKRDELLATMPREVAAVYARVAQGRGGTAVVKIEGTSCGGCFAQLPPQTVNEVKKMEALITCETCGRILVWAQD